MLSTDEEQNRCPLPSALSSQAVDLRSHDEIVFVQTLNFMGLHRNFRVAPAEGDIGVMAFLFGKFADLIHEGDRFFKVFEAKRAFDPRRIVHNDPVLGLWKQLFRLRERERRHATPTRNASFLGELFCHRTHHRKIPPLKRIRFSKPPAITASQARERSCPPDEGPPRHFRGSRSWNKLTVLEWPVRIVQDACAAP